MSSRKTISFDQAREKLLEKMRKMKTTCDCDIYELTMSVQRLKHRTQRAGWYGGDVRIDTGRGKGTSSIRSSGHSKSPRQKKEQFHGQRKSLAIAIAKFCEIFHVPMWVLVERRNRWYTFKLDDGLVRSTSVSCLISIADL